MSRITELERAESLPSDRCVFPVGNALVLFCLLLACFLCMDLSAAEDRKESALTQLLKNELAYLKTQNVLSTEIVSRYRNLYLEMPVHLSSEERDVLEQYQQEYSRLRKASELAKAEKVFERYAHLDAERQRTIAEERARQNRFQKAPLIVPKKPAAVDVKKKKTEAAKKATAQTMERIKVEKQMKTDTKLSIEVNDIKKMLLKQ